MAHVRPRARTGEADLDCGSLSVLGVDRTGRLGTRLAEGAPRREVPDHKAQGLVDGDETPLAGVTASSPVAEHYEHARRDDIRTPDGRSHRTGHSMAGHSSDPLDRPWLARQPGGRSAGPVLATRLPEYHDGTDLQRLRGMPPDQHLVTWPQSRLHAGARNRDQREPLSRQHETRDTGGQQ